MKKPLSFDPREVLSRAIAQHQAGRFAEAEKLYRQLIEVLPELEPLYSNLGATLISQNKLTEAEKALQKALQLNAGSVDAQMNAGALYTQQGRLKQAESAYRKVIDIQPASAVAYYNLGNVLREQGRADDAIEAYKTALQFDPGLQQASQNLSVAYQQKGQLQEAARLLEKSKQLEGENDRALSDLAYVKLKQNKHEEARALFQKAIDKNPSNDMAFAGLAELLLDLDLPHESLGLIEQAIVLKPEYANHHLLLGNVQRSLKKPIVAIEAYKKALSLNPGLKEAESNLNRTYMWQIPSWHFTMLADEKRNLAFQQAIERAVDEQSVVLDIGTGSGLLAMMAARAGARKVTACEMVSVLADAARDIVAANAYADRITVINKKSSNLQPGQDMDEKANVIVSEILDAGLLGEGVIPSLRHAQQELAVPGARVIPQGAEVYAALLEIPARRKVAPVGNISGFDLSAFNRFRVADEYTTVILATEKHRLLSDAVPVADYDFRNLPPHVPDTQPLHKSISFQATETGTVQAVTFWFKMRMDDELEISSGPGGEMVHWGQAVSYLEKDVEVKAGEQLQLHMYYSDSLIRFSLLQR